MIKLQKSNSGRYLMELHAIWIGCEHTYAHRTQAKPQNIVNESRICGILYILYMICMCVAYNITELCTHWVCILMQNVYQTRKPLCLCFIVHPSKNNVLIEMRNTHVQRTRQHHSLAAAKKKMVQRNSFINEGISVVSVPCSYSCGLYVVCAAGSVNRQSQIANRMSGATTMNLYTHKNVYGTIDTHTLTTIIEFFNWIFCVNTELRRNSPANLKHFTAEMCTNSAIVNKIRLSKLTKRINTFSTHGLPVKLYITFFCVCSFLRVDWFFYWYYVYVLSSMFGACYGRVTVRFELYMTLFRHIVLDIFVLDSIDMFGCFGVLGTAHQHQREHFVRFTSLCKKDVNRVGDAKFHADHSYMRMFCLMYRRRGRKMTQRDRERVRGGGC